MSDFLYFIFVYPLESLLGYVLKILHSCVHHYGLAIIFLSVLVNLFLLPLFLKADKMSKDHAKIKAELDLKIKEFKRVFKGMELHAYTKTLFRQRHYHPIYALKALVGLILQVPFFIAVVFLLEFHSPELRQIKFLWIKDLSHPDSLLFGVHFLPFLMSFFTLINVWISSNDRSSRIQGIVITLIFLILLYQMPSSLLLYWTTSMLFSMIKSFCMYRKKDNEIF